MNDRKESRTTETFLPLLASNLVPLAGIAFLGWRVQNVLFLYWLEIGLVVVIYGGLTLFAERKPNPESRTVSPMTVSVPFLSSRSGTTRPVEWLPPIYYRNVSYAAGLLVWGLGFWLCLSVLMVVLPSPVVVENPYSNSEAIYEYASIFASVLSPEILLSALALLVSQLDSTRRQFLGEARYEQLSAPMTVEIPVRRMVFWFLLTPVAEFVLPLLTLPLAGLFDTRVLFDIGIATLVVLGKLTVEWSSFRARHRENPSGVAGWFTPEESK
ncbi:DUF6498-containing protein [Halorussus sp. MSC15.2]|uniref:DUF6498-containing protein n=1 Tax=Halorussus sp. MSC15.2 TaxID=2283638 RepID=UPI0013D5F839|nr:DUF6498-containing protein [Halorussus sp. MSC15.2]NEU56796.1 hypothetical protein [Halorussus sp. MSC15.2]